MKNITSLLLIIFSITLNAQEIGQDFCAGTKKGTFFPLDIAKKKVYWGDSYYFEYQNGSKMFNGLSYVENIQEWDFGQIDTMYFRTSKGNVYQYDHKANAESPRFFEKYKKKKTWTIANGAKYEFIRDNAKLKTLYCHYKNLLVYRFEAVFGTWDFYYLRGYGYVGATENGKLISYVSPEF